MVGCWLSPPELFLLDLACKPIKEAYGVPPYLVGSAAEARDYRDVDVRLILPDDEYDRLVPTPEIRAMLSMAYSVYLRQVTGLPVDFGVQRRTDANTAFIGGIRNPLGMRALDEFRSDAESEDV